MQGEDREEGGGRVGRRRMGRQEEDGEAGENG